MLVAAVVAAVLLAGGGSTSGSVSSDEAALARASAPLSTLKFMPRVVLGRAAPPGSSPPPTDVKMPIPARYAVSLDLALARGATARVALAGSRGATARFSVARSGSGAVILSAGARRLTLSRQAGWLRGSAHFELVPGRLLVNGESVPVPRVRGPGATLRFSTQGAATANAVLISSLSDQGSLLLHRVAELHARVATGAFPEGADVHDQLHFSSGWTDGFWAGSLWQATALAPAAGTFRRWALIATQRHFGQERADTHDLGFMYGQSSLAAWRVLCRGRAGAPRGSRALCSRLRDSALTAARQLLVLVRTNPGAGTIPTNSTSRSADTIVDSLMNIGILTWAGALTHDRRLGRLALHHAHVVASLLVRGDGSTAQSVHFDRRTGQVLFIHTHQGISAQSAWSRGQAWAVYGLSQTAADLRDPPLLAAAQRAAGYVSRTLPASGVPRWDYDARPGAPVDVSAGMITAAGLMRLARACRVVPGGCDDPGKWQRLGQRMLAASLTYASRRPPLGLLRGQALNEHGHGCWCNGGELIFGLSYGLEALALQRGVE